MAIDILMPALSPTMEKGNLSKWHKAVGDSIEPGDVIAEVETDKATMEVEAVDEGVLEAIVVAEGTEDVSVNAVIARMSGDAAPVIINDGNAPDNTDAKAPTPAAPITSNEIPPPESTIMHAPEWPEGTELKALSVREALRDAMAEEMRLDQDVFVMGEEVAEYQGAYKVTQGLLDEFGEKRVIDTPITEHGFTGIGVGAAMAGLKPIVEFMTFNFAMQAIDQIINSAAKTLYMSGGQINCPIVFRGPNGAAARVAAQHSQDYAAWYASVPGLTVVMPHTAADAKGLLKSAIRNPNPVVFLENELLYGQSFDVPVLDDWTVPLGKAKQVRTGEDITLVSWGIGMTYVLKAAEILAEKGIEADVIDLRTIRPYDLPMILASVRKTNRCVVVEEAWPQCSQSAEIAARIMAQAFDDLDAPVLTVTGKDVPMPYAVSLEKLALPTVQDVVEAAEAVTYTGSM